MIPWHEVLFNPSEVSETFEVDKFLFFTSIESSAKLGIHFCLPSKDFLSVKSVEFEGVYEFAKSSNSIYSTLTIC